MSSRLSSLWLPIFAITGAVIVVVMLLFVLQTLIAPRLLAGTLSEPIPQVCSLGKQWVIYDCKPNALTGFGCIVPGGAGEYLTFKSIAVETSPCLPNRDGTVGGERVITWHWQPYGTGTSCRSSGAQCCNYSESCIRTEQYLCVQTGAGFGGEDQCVPSYLPAPVPDFDKNTNVYTVNPITVNIPCREGFC